MILSYGRAPIASRRQTPNQVRRAMPVAKPSAKSSRLLIPRPEQTRSSCWSVIRPHRTPHPANTAEDHLQTTHQPVRPSASMMTFVQASLRSSFPARWRLPSSPPAYRSVVFLDKNCSSFISAITARFNAERTSHEHYRIPSQRHT